MNKNTKLSPNIPAGYPFSLHADCPKAKTCLRQLVFCRCDEMGTYLNLIYSSATLMSGSSTME